MNAAVGQSYLIPPNAASNIYPITFTDEAQQTLILEFDRAVTAPGTSAGWTITVGGVAVPLSGNPTAAGNFLRIVLSSGISYADRNSVLVTYNPLVGNMALTGGVEPNFTNVQAVNNYIATSADFSNGLYGEIAPVDICAPVVDVQVESNIVMSRRYRNSIHYSLPKIWIQWEYPNAFPRTLGFYAEVGGAGTGVFRSQEPYAGYPDNTLNCTWDVSIYPYLYNTGTLQPNLYVTVNQIVIQLPNYKRDNGTPAPGTGSLGIDPPVDDPRTLFCVGDDITAFVFEDETVFDCQLPVEPDLPNIYTRHVQYVYGTHTSAGIPNVFIDVNGMMVQVTDNNGAPISGTWYVNPDGTPNGAGYTTPSGFFEGPVIKYVWDFFTRTLVTPMAETYPIYHTGDFINDQAGDIFDVTLRNWGPCNAYDGGNPFTHVDAVTEFSRLRLIESPPLPTAPDVFICFGGSTTLTAVRNGAPNPGLLHWYSDAALTNEVATGNTYTPPVSAVGTYTYYVREISGSTGNCPGPAEDIVLTINPIPSTPTITRSGADFCYDGSSSVTLTANPNTPPAVSSYQWYRNGTPVGGAVTNTIVLDAIAQSGSYTVRTFGVAPTFCPSPLSPAVSVLIGQPATVNAGADQSVCSTTNSISVTGTRGGSATSSTWSTSGTGTFASPSSLTTNYTFSAADKTAGTVTLTLTTNDPAGPCPAVSDALVVTISPAATVNAGADQTICSTTPTINLSGSIGGGAGWANWSTTGSGTFADAANPVTTYTPSAADITAGTVTLTLTTNNPAGPCPASSDAMVLTIRPAATVNAGADQSICSTSTVSLTGTRGGGATSSTWSTSGTGTFANASALNTIYTPGAADITAGTVTLTLTTNDPAGPCPLASDAMTVTIFPAATVNAGPDQSICALASATLAGSIGGSAVSASWSGGTGTYAPNANTLNAVYTPSAAERTAGTVTLTLTTNDPAGPCSPVSDNMTIAIGSSPTGATIAGSGDVCFGGSSWFRVDITGGAWPYTLNYTINGTPQTYAGYTSGTHIDLGVLAVNIYTIVVTSITDNCTTPVPGLPKSYIINVNPIPTLSSTLTPAAICSATAFSYTPTSATVGTTFSWTRATVAGITPVGPTSGNGNPNETLTNTTAAPIIVTYVYTLTANGCTNTQNVTV
ncbi:MAG: hypothetical protein IH592_02925, partial [Bacteroidales bacterium]|nr:hypothetical protein [Bacteroidales bacterium]